RRTGASRRRHRAGAGDGAAGNRDGRRPQGLREFEEHPHPPQGTGGRADDRVQLQRCRQRHRRSGVPAAGRHRDRPRLMSGSNRQHTMRHHGLVTFVALAFVAVLLPARLAAQDSNFALSGDTRPVLVPGWTVTPSVLYQGVWDDNVLVRGTGDEAPRDFLNIFNPKANVTFLGRRGQIDADYDGAFVFYRQLETLNSYDQHARFTAQRLVTRHVTLFVTDSFAA